MANRYRTDIPPVVMPSEALIRRTKNFLQPWRFLTSPHMSGLERIPDSGPLLFIGNHSTWGVLDAPLMFLELYERRGMFVRSMGDRMHGEFPIWRDLMTNFGVVEGSHKNFQTLMDAGESVLVFPGGAREVTKRKTEKYQIIWKQRSGFAKMAIQYGCTIVPFSALGAEDAFDIVLDADDVMQSPIGPLLRRMGVRDDMIFPLVRGIGPTPFPRPTKLYFRFGQPFETKSLQGQHSDPNVCWDLRERVREEVQTGLDELMTFRQTDPEQDTRIRLMNALAGALLGEKSLPPRR